MGFEQWVINLNHICSMYIFFVNHPVCLFGEGDIYELKALYLLFSCDHQSHPIIS